MQDGGGLLEITDSLPADASVGTSDANDAVDKIRGFSFL